MNAANYVVAGDRRGCRLSLAVQQESRASIAKVVKAINVSGEDLSVWSTIDDCAVRSIVAQQAKIGVSLPRVGVVAHKKMRDFESGSDRLKLFSISNSHAQAATLLARKLAGVRRELKRSKRNARQLKLAKLGSQCHTIEPRRANNFEWRVGPTAHRQIGRFENADAWIQDRFGQAAHVGRGVNPRQVCRVEELRTLPAFEFDDLQLDVDSQLILEEQGEFANRHSVPDRYAMKADERLLAIVEYRACNGSTVDRIRPVENDKPDAEFARCLHGVTHGRYIGIEARTDVLNIEYDRIDLIEHRRCWPMRVSVETKNGNAGVAFSAITNNGDVELSLQPVFGTENAHEINCLGIVQNSNGAFAVSIDTRLIGDQCNSLPAKRCEIITRQNVNAGQYRHVSVTGRQLHNAQQKRDPFAVSNEIRAHKVQTNQHN